ncbi:MAG TPA: hypothetical protein VIX20_17880, partial [Ktedonobacteraceae bacterium]
PILARNIRQCVSDEEASELLYSSLSEITKSFTEGLSTVFDTRISSEQLAKAKSLEGTRMPDGAKHD